MGEEYQWDRKLSPASGLMRTRVNYVLKDRISTLQFRGYATALTLFRLAMSATAVNADLQASASVQGGSTPASAAFRFISGRFESWQLKGQEGGIFEGEFSMQFAEVSALWA